MDLDWQAMEHDRSAEWDALDNADIYAIRVVFAERDSNETHVTLMPWLTYDVTHAHTVCHTFVYHAEEGLEMIQQWLLSGDVNLPPHKDWQPIGARVVKLAPIPF